MAARWRREDGVETSEVALIGALVLIAILVAVPVLFGGVESTLNSVTTAIMNAGAGIE
jgi:Flp pilus assembly pilin Flp